MFLRRQVVSTSTSLNCWRGLHRQLYVRASEPYGRIPSSRGSASQCSFASLLQSFVPAATATIILQRVRCLISCRISDNCSSMGSCFTISLSWRCYLDSKSDSFVFCCMGPRRPILYLSTWLLVSNSLACYQRLIIDSILPLTSLDLITICYAAMFMRFRIEWYLGQVGDALSCCIGIVHPDLTNCFYSYLFIFAVMNYIASSRSGTAQYSSAVCEFPALLVPITLLWAFFGWLFVSAA